MHVAASHGLVDMQSLVQVLSDWSKLVKGDVVDINRSTLEMIRNRRNLILSKSIREAPDMAELTCYQEQLFTEVMTSELPQALASKEVRNFGFTRQDVNDLKEVVMNGRAWSTFEKKGYRLSAHDVITALLWKGMAMVHPSHYKQDWGLVVVINLRGKTEKIPIDYFGNATTQPKTARTMKQVVYDMDLSECALVVRELGYISKDQVEQIILRKNRIQYGDGSEESNGKSDIDRLINIAGNTPDNGCGLYIFNFTMQQV